MFISVTFVNLNLKWGFAYLSNMYIVVSGIYEEIIPCCPWRTSGCDTTTKRHPLLHSNTGYFVIKIYRDVAIKCLKIAYLLKLAQICNVDWKKYTDTLAKWSYSCFQNNVPVIVLHTWRILCWKNSDSSGSCFRPLRLIWENYGLCLAPMILYVNYPKYSTYRTLKVEHSNKKLTMGNWYIQSLDGMSRMFKNNVFTFVCMAVLGFIGWR